ncbi:helix-turn-helix domain-containing protein [Yeguia hominis]|uniref:DNA-binding protein n=1 Tax=Yeguia hominis TaxID=2763662 RepID=A0A926D897_9FIRM|nr:helix-turn-helix domain-containing protein [Yeguia hominis]MBC8534250.1 DNA-binding protein [Yeguia hominis]
MIKKTMSVREMGALLGLKKVDSYWLVHKNYFKTVLVAGKMRVLVDSFEEWYAGQFHYKKIDGTKPGQKYAYTMSVHEASAIIGVSDGVMYDLIKRYPIKAEIINNRTQIYIDSFEEWYATQDKYRKVTPEGGTKDV